MKKKGDAKFKGKMNCDLKNDLKNLINFHASSQTSGNLHYDGFFCPKHLKIQIKKYKIVISHIIEECAKFEKKITLGSKNDMRNLVNFNVSSGKSESLHFDVLLFSIAYKVSAKKVQKNDLS